ncbi:MAG TPA: glycosyltransferase [Steroidobacteraceae bacterium]|nr:glycosyltransferase [Steroidobacteraceae bacterium]
MTASKPLSILSIAHPFAPVRADTVGGAEQVLAHLDRALVDAGHRSTVIAVDGSRVAGRLIASRAADGIIDATARRRACSEVREAMVTALAREPFDLIHLHSLEFHEHLPPPGVPALVTLHLPLELYPEAALRPSRPGTWLLPVSASQARGRPDLPLLSPIENGVDLLAKRPHARRGYALALGRICPEKNFADALDAARSADCPLLLAGRVYEYPEHLRYFHCEITPRLDRSRRWIGCIAGSRKRRLVAGARCVLIPSRIAETSSLVAMEALAAGVPVIAYPAGALPDIVEHGRTGFIAGDVPSMARAIRAASGIDPEDCRRAARKRFCAQRMTGEYLTLYQRLAATRVSPRTLDPRASPAPPPSGAAACS